jgi:arylsulfatase A-like enzyme
VGVRSALPILLALGAADLSCRHRAEVCEPAGEPTLAPAEAPRNVLMISVDTLRRDRLGFYGEAPSPSPFIDSMLADGLVLMDHTSCANWTFASMMCGLTGKYNEEGGYVLDADQMQKRPFPTETLPISRWLGDLGWRTGLVSANTWMSADYGFDDYYNTLVTAPAWKADEIVLEALAAADEVVGDGDAPWFFHVHFIDPHIPYSPPREYLTELQTLPPFDEYALNTDGGVWELRDNFDSLSPERQALALEHLRIRYNAEITFVDDQLRRLLDGLSNKGMLEDTLVVFFSDHGEQFFERGDVGHRKQLHAEENAGVAAFWGPGIAPETWEGPTSHVDLFPTLAYALGLAPPADLTGRAVGTRSEECPRHASSIKGGETLNSIDVAGMRLIYRWDGALELYDLAADPGEEDDLYAPGDERAAALWEIMEPRVELIADIYDAEKPTPPSP